MLMPSNKGLYTCSPVMAFEHIVSLVRPRGRMRDALLGLALLSAGCGHAARSGMPEPEAKTTVRVRNQNFLDMDVLVVLLDDQLRAGFHALYPGRS